MAMPLAAIAGPVLEIAKGGIQAGGAAIGAGAGGIAAGAVPGSKVERRDYRRLRDMVKKNQTGLGEYEKERIRQQALQAASSGALSRNAAIIRGVAAGGNPAAVQQLDLNQQNAMANAAALGAGQAEVASQQKAAMQRQEFFARLEAKKAKAAAAGQAIGGAIAGAASSVASKKEKNAAPAVTGTDIAKDFGG